MQSPYQRFVDLLAVPALLLHADGTVVKANAAAAVHLGPQVSQAGSRLHDLVTEPPSSVDACLKIWSRSPHSTPGALTFRAGNQTPVPCRCEGALLQPPSANGPALLLLQAMPRQQAHSSFATLTERLDILNRQVAQRRQTEEALQRSQERMAGIIESAMDAIITVDAEQRIIVFNRAAEKIFRCSAADALGHPLDRFIPPELRRAHRTHVQNFGRTGTTSRSMYSPGTLTGMRATGEKFPLEASISQIESGGQKLFTVILRDITERKQAEEALRKSEQRLRVAQSAAAMGTWEWDIAGGKVFWSEEVPVLHGLPPMSFDGDQSEWLKLAVHPEDQPYVRDALRKALSGEAEYDVEFRTIWPDGSLHWIGARAQVYRDSQGNPQRMVGIGMDITSRKQAQETLRTTEKLAAAGRLAATISHEINNPLEAVTNLLYLLENHAGLDESGRHYASLAQEELARVTHIARQTLAFYRETSSPAPVMLSTLVDEVLGLLGSRLRNRNVTIETEMEDVPPITAFAGELRQVVSNLLVNAVDAVEAGGKVRVRVRQARHWSDPAVRGLRLVVADNGSGIAPRHRSSVFEPFFTTKGERGTGLGLWVTHGIVQKHGGSIRLRSRADDGHHGTCFSVFLPFESAAIQAASQGLVASSA